MNELFLGAEFVKVTDVYNNYIKKHNDYLLSFEQFYLSIFQYDIDLYCHTYNIGIDSDIAIFPLLDTDNVVGDGSEMIFSAKKYSIWRRENEKKIKSVNHEIESRVNRYSIHGGIFFLLRPSSHFKFYMGYHLDINFLPLEWYSLHGELIIDDDYVLSVCEKYIVEEIESFNTSPITYRVFIKEWDTSPKLTLNKHNILSEIQTTIDLLFFKKIDAQKILNNTFDDFHEESQLQNINKKPIGISNKKMDAKRYAKFLADHLWNKDREQKIRIKEMAITIYVELSQTEHRDQLPDKPESLKDWIKEVAPDYARGAGRPSEK